jgi:4-hydroxyphenylpyruvate dioxygenase
VSEPLVLGFDRLELWVGSARHAASFFSHVLGFSVADAHPHVEADRVSYLLQQGDARIVLTGARSAESPVADYVRVHGDGVRDIGFLVDDVTAAHESVVGRGASPVRAPHRSGPGNDCRASVGAFGDAIHTLFDRSDAPRRGERSAVGLVALDHLAVSVESGSREHWVRQYEETFGFERVGHDEHIEVDGSAFNMTTVRASRGSATLVFVEPDAVARRSQIADYLDHFRGPGVHHIAFASDDILETVAALHSRGLRMLDVPSGYYVAARERLVGLDVPWAELEHFGVLVDRDEEGHLFQVFTEPIGDRPTVYLEIIQRVGATGFGHDNVRALYHAVVREQQGRDRV